MKCSKCGNELKSGQKFCTKCGNKNNNIGSKITGTEYSTNKQVTIAILGSLLPLCFVISAIQVYGLFHIGTLICIAITVLFVAMSILTFLEFNCPNCNEKITLNSRKLNTINESNSSCLCPKCNRELIFNTRDKTVYINRITDKEENTTHSNTSKLEELYNLKTKGIITEEEFESKKKELLDKM